jgi:hypothetical protein
MSTDVSEVRAASNNALMMEAARISETSVDIQLSTRQYIPKDSELHTRRRENLKSHESSEVCWKGWKGREGEGRQQIYLPFTASFLHSVVRMLGSGTKISGQKL